MAAVGALVGCSSEEASTDPGRSTQTSGAPVSATVGTCDFRATVTGQDDADLEGEGQFVGATDVSQPSLYLFAAGKDRLTVLASDGEFPTAVTYSRGKRSYSTQGDAGIDADSAGDGATFDVTASGLAGEVEISGNVECDLKK
ncbi:hypothetical protein [uncultured Nocardioides sp.]|uniref:hypothetical protein n=1 Tax=uncultured Nocardioides sp. TaxID=198441 RepID=UPI00261D8F36|nr:hypothetical protein [uncultured Nocardioides sp.]